MLVSLPEGARSGRLKKPDSLDEASQFSFDSSGPVEKRQRTWEALTHMQFPKDAKFSPMVIADVGTGVSLQGGLRVFLARCVPCAPIRRPPLAEWVQRCGSNHNVGFFFFGRASLFPPESCPSGHHSHHQPPTWLWLALLRCAPQ